MKWSTVAAVLAAPLALAGSIERDLGFVERRNSMEVRSSHGESVKSESNGKGSQVVKVGGSTTVIIQEVIIIWVHNGGSGTTTQVNSETTKAGAAAAATHTVRRVFFLTFRVSI